MTKPIPTPQSTHSPTLTPPSTPTYPPFVSAYSTKNKSALYFEGPGRTQQQFKDECDINNIMKRFEATGVVTHLNGRPPQFGDIADLDFQGAMDAVIDARNRFEALPSKVRDRFQNDPQRLLDFIADSNNAEEARKLGLLASAEPPPVSPTTPTPATPPSAS